MNINSTSTEYVMIPVFPQALTQAADGSFTYDPTGDTVKVAFLVSTTAQPTSGQWNAASWATPGPSQYAIVCLVGPNGGVITLPPQIYRVWVWIGDSPETPIEMVGELVVT